MPQRVLVKKRAPQTQAQAPSKARGHFDPNINVDSPRSSLSAPPPPKSSSSTSTPTRQPSYSTTTADSSASASSSIAHAHAVPPQPGRPAPVPAAVSASTPLSAPELVHPTQVSPADLSDLLSDLNAVPYQTDFTTLPPPIVPPPRLPTKQPSVESLQAYTSQTLSPESSGLSSERSTAVANPAVRLSQSFAATGRLMDDLTQPRGEPSGMRSPRQRYSDETRDGKAIKKKSGFSNFVNNLVGTQRKPTISAPENPVHVTHVGYDQETGEFTVGNGRDNFVTAFADVLSRVYPRNGNEHCRPMASRSRNRRRTRRLSSMWSLSLMKMQILEVMTGRITNLTMPDLTTAHSRWHHLDTRNRMASVLEDL